VTGVHDVRNSRDQTRAQTCGIRDASKPVREVHRGRHRRPRRWIGGGFPEWKLFTSGRGGGSVSERGGANKMNATANVTVSCAGDTVFDAAGMRGLKVTSICSALLSLCGSTFIVLTWLLQRGTKRSLGMHVMVHLSAADLLSSLVIIVDGLSPTTELEECGGVQELCGLLAGLSQFSSLAAVLWTGCMALVLHLGVVRRSKLATQHAGRLRLYMHLGVWGTAAFSLLLMVAVPGTLGPIGQWCAGHPSFEHAGHPSLNTLVPPVLEARCSLRAAAASCHPSLNTVWSQRAAATAELTAELTPLRLRASLVRPSSLLLSSSLLSCSLALLLSSSSQVLDPQGGLPVGRHPLLLRPSHRRLHLLDGHLRAHAAHAARAAPRRLRRRGAASRRRRRRQLLREPRQQRRAAQPHRAPEHLLTRLWYEAVDRTIPHHHPWTTPCAHHPWTTRYAYHP
jgi:hypothetical protein